MFRFAAREIHLFAFLGAVAAGTFFGGPVGDRMGRKVVIWYSILGVLPFTLVLPYANLFWTGILSVVIGLILASAFSTILVFAQELVPTKVGTISGTFFGLAFGLGGIGAALLGKLADATNIRFVYHVCSFLPAVGILTAFLPDLNSRGEIKRDKFRAKQEKAAGLRGLRPALQGRAGLAAWHFGHLRLWIVIGRWRPVAMAALAALLEFVNPMTAAGAGLARVGG